MIWVGFVPHSLARNSTFFPVKPPFFCPRLPINKFMIHTIGTDTVIIYFYFLLGLIGASLHATYECAPICLRVFVRVDTT